MAGIIMEPGTSETRYKLQQFARHQMITHLYNDIRIDMEICEIEGWDKMEYIKQLDRVHIMV